MAKLTVDASRPVKPFPHFWQSTGFTPADLILKKEMEQQLIYVGAVPHRGIIHVRIHYLLDLVKAAGLGTARPDYNWSDLDRGIDLLVTNRLKPFFELMGNPSGYFTDFLNDGQLHAWRRLVRDLATHLIDRYGRDEVRSWYFETWNEPDGGWWHQWPQEEPFRNYYDACSEGLAEADRELKFGGPGTCKTLSPLFKALMAHCAEGTNYFTGKKGVRIDFISIHEKGIRSHKEDVTPNNRTLCEREAQILTYVRESHPALAATPFMNNECDPIVGWGDIHTWHALPYYAALVCKVINQHRLVLADDMGCDYPILSNDNGFTGPWGARSLMARIGKDKELEQERFELVKKPVVAAMELLSLLGDTALPVSGTEGPWADLGVLATRRADGQVAVLVYNHNDSTRRSGGCSVELEITGLPFDKAILAHYRIDEDHTNPFRAWDEADAPADAAKPWLEEARRRQEPELLAEPAAAAIRGSALTVTFDLPLPGLSLIVLTADPGSAPDRVRGLRATTYKGLTRSDNLLLAWEGLPSRAIRTYEVLFSEEADGSFVRVNEPDLLSTAFMHVRRTSRGAGFYKVRAVDYWGRAGVESEVLEA